MKVKFYIEINDIKNIQSIVAQQQNNPQVKRRKSQNVIGPIPVITTDKIWKTMLECLLTTQQRSGPKSPVYNMINQKPFPLTLDICHGSKDVAKLIESTLMNYRGIRFRNNIAKRAAVNLNTLEIGGWEQLMDFARRLMEQRRKSPKPSHFKLERKASEFIMENYQGFGPKQSRNFWQTLGLTRYEFLLDSRITRWLRDKLNFPFPSTSAPLSDERYYVFISDILRDLCIKAKVLPCIFDAAVFSSYEK